jgi:hypothetical protein
MYKGMLRITLPSANGSGTFVLEGRLVGLWAQELLRVAREANQGNESIFDLQDVFYVDSTGEQALRMLSQYGARFITDSAYGKDLCKRLKLHRISVLEVSPCQQKEEQCSRRPQTMPKATTAASSNAEVLGHKR